MVLDISEVDACMQSIGWGNYYQNEVPCLLHKNLGSMRTLYNDTKDEFGAVKLTKDNCDIVSDWLRHLGYMVSWYGDTDEGMAGIYAVKDTGICQQVIILFDQYVYTDMRKIDGLGVASSYNFEKQFTPAYKAPCDPTYPNTYHRVKHYNAWVYPVNVNTEDGRDELVDLLHVLTIDNNYAWITTDSRVYAGDWSGVSVELSNVQVFGCVAHFCGSNKPAILRTGDNIVIDDIGILHILRKEVYEKYTTEPTF